MRTRPGLKSCLKITPPITPDLSAASSPCGSGRTSPAPHSDGGSSVGSGGRKTVSFCSQEELEEIYFADEWDRSPAAVTPKLSYQYVLVSPFLFFLQRCSPPLPTLLPSRMVRCLFVVKEPACEEFAQCPGAFETFRSGARRIWGFGGDSGPRHA